MALVNANTIANSAGTGAPSLPFGAAGITDGSSVVAGSIGQVIESVVTSDFSQSTPTVSTYYDATSGSVSLTAGIWRITAFGVGLLQQTSSNANLATMQMAIRDGSNNVRIVSAVSTAYDNGATSIDTILGSVYLEDYVNITSTTTYKISIRYVNFDGTASVSAISLRTSAASYGDRYFIRGLRIA